MGGAEDPPRPRLPCAVSPALPLLGSPPFRALAGGRSWARSIVERRGETRGSRAEAPPPARLPPGRRGCTWQALQPGCGERPGLAGSAAAPGTCALAQTSRDHEPDRPRLLLHAQLLCKCRPRLLGLRAPAPVTPAAPPRASPRDSEFLPIPLPKASGRKGGLFLFFLEFALIFGAGDCRSPGMEIL